MMELVAVAAAQPGLALLLWGTDPVRRLGRNMHAKDRRPWRRWWPAFAAVVVLVWFRHHLALAIAGLVAGACLRRSLRTWRRARTAKRHREHLRLALRLLVGHLQAGASAEAAARSVAAELSSGTDGNAAGDHPVARAFVAAARSLRRGGRAASHLAAASQDVAELRGLAGAWELAEHHGIALCPLIEQVHRRLDQQLRHTSRTQAALQGPKATAVIVSILPLASMALGAAMGINAPAVLLGSGIGNVLLIVGVGLLAAGVLWTQRIIERATS